MTKKFKAIIFASVIFVSSCSDKKEIDPISEAQWKALSYLPGDTQFLVFINLNELRKTEFLETYFKSSFESKAHQPPAEIIYNLSADRQDSSSTEESNLFNRSNVWLSNLEKETGVGLKHGISNIFLSSNKEGVNTAIVYFESGIGKVKSYFNKNSIHINFEGKEIFQSHIGQSLFYFIDDSTLIAANSNKYLKSLNPKIGEKNSLKRNKNIIDIIKGIQNKKHFWIASKKSSYTETLLSKIHPFGKIILNSYRNIPAKSILKSIDDISLSAKFGKEIEIELTLGCSDIKNAYLLTAAIKGALAMELWRSDGFPLSGSDFLLDGALEKMEVERNNKKINLKVNLEDDDIKHLKDIVKKNNIDKKL